MKKRFFRFEEETIDNELVSYIFPMSCNLGAYKMLSKAFNDLEESNYRVYYFDVNCKEKEPIPYDALNLSKFTRVVNGIIDTHQLSKYLDAIEDGDDFFVEGGLLKLVAYFIKPDMVF